MREALWILTCFFLRKVFGSSDSMVYCDDTYGKYISLSGNLNLRNFEFPIMDTVPYGSSSVADYAMPKLLHPCYSLNGNSNYKNQLYDIFDYGEFAPSVCSRSCAHFVDTFFWTCGDRRPAPDWIVGTLDTSTRKINCSDWDLPLTDKGKVDGIYLSYRFAYYNSDTGEDYDPAYTIDDASLKYLDQFFIKGLHIRPLFDRPSAKKAARVTAFADNVVSFLTRHPEVSHIAIGEPTVSFQDETRTATKYITPYLKLNDEVWQKLGASDNLRTLAFTRIEYNGTENVPYNFTRNLKSIGLYDVSLTSNKLPDWISGSNIQLLDIRVTVNDSTDISAWDQLEQLEHFMLRESRITTIKSPFLAKSDKLISLTLQCNGINTIQENAFDHLVNLKYLNIAGNQLVTLPDQIFVKLTNLLVFDVRALDLSTLTIRNFDDTLYSCQSDQSLNTTFYLNSIPKLPNPENIKALEVRGQKNFNFSTLPEFKNLEILNIGNLDITTLNGLQLEKMCSLTDLNLYDNPLNSTDWMDEEFFYNVDLKNFRMGMASKLVDVPNPLIAFMRTSSQIQYNVPQSLIYFSGFRATKGCSYDTVQSATMYGYVIQNTSCTTQVESALEAIRTMESVKMDTTCVST